MALVRAAETANLVEISRLLADEVSVDESDEYGSTAMHAAAAAGNVQVLKFLLQADAKVDIPNRQGETPLILATKVGQFNAIKVLLEAGADPNARWNYLKTRPLHLAAQYGHTLAVDKLISAGAFVNALNSRSWSPLVYAAINGHVETVSYLLKVKADPDVRTESGDCSLHEAAFNGRSGVIAQLITAQASVDLVNDVGETALLRAADGGHTDVVERLITASASLDVTSHSGETALMAAARGGHVTMVAALLNGGANVQHENKDGCCALSLAAQNGHHRVVRLLLSNGGVSDGQLMLALKAALWFGRRKAVKEFRFFVRPSPVLIDIRPHGLCDILDKEIHPLLTTELCLTVSSTSEAAISSHLNESMVIAGFVRSRALVHSAACSTIERRLGDMPSVSKYCIVGSVSDGWGCSLTCASGRVDSDSDIDIVNMPDKVFYHINGWCGCNEEHEKCDYIDGHLIVSGQTGNPAFVEPGSSVRPALDLVTAYKCCCYPMIPILQQPGCADEQKQQRTNIPSPVLDLLRSELRNSPCHVVCAAAPGQEGRQLRVSTSFLERCLMRSLSTVQGQLFVLLKYFIKKVICRHIHGLKAYNAKTLLFRMLDKTPQSDWRSDHLVQLIDRALELLITDLQSPQLTNHQSAWHFFLPDAAIYLKSGHAEKETIVREVQKTRENLHKLLTKFVANLQPVSKSSTFQIQFLLLFPHGFSDSVLGPSRAGVGGIFYSLRYLFQAVASRSESTQSLLNQIDCLPDSVMSARRCLRVLTLLMSQNEGDRAEAERILREGWGKRAVRGVQVDPKCELTPDEALSMVQGHLSSTDSCTKFCFTYFGSPPVLRLPNLSFVSDNFPKRLRNFQNRQVFVNFDAMFRALGMELLQLDGTTWFDELVEEDADVQELQVALRFCDDADRLSRLICRHSRVIASDKTLGLAALKVVQSRIDLQQSLKSRC